MKGRWITFSAALGPYGLAHRGGRRRLRNRDMDRYRWDAQQRPPLCGRHKPRGRTAFRRGRRTGLFRSQNPASGMCAPGQGQQYSCASAQHHGATGTRHSHTQHRPLMLDKGGGRQRRHYGNKNQIVAYAAGLGIHAPGVRDFRQLPQADRYDFDLRGKCDSHSRLASETGAYTRGPQGARHSESR